ncbi:hypothetical protein AAE028_36340, partial [Sinorhizobium sp. CB9]
NAGETADGLTLGFAYARDIFERETIERIATHYGELLSQIAEAGEGTRLGELTLSVPTDHRQPADYPFIPVTDRIGERAL